MNNFEKLLNNFTENELIDKIRETPPEYGVLFSYELIRRIEIENSKSSKRFARWSLILSIVAIALSI